MIYLHEKNISEKFVRHWANESESSEDQVSTYKVKQIETGVLYEDAIDIFPCHYTYEATNEPVKSVDTSWTDCEAEDET